MTEREITKAYFSASEFAFKEDGDGGVPGRLTAIFSTFDIEDRSGDIVVSGALDAFKNVELPLCWSHDWSNPIGKGTLKVFKDHAEWDGYFWLDTDSGMEAYKKVKNSGSMQEYSWGFRVLESEPIKDADEDEDDWYWWGPIKILKAEPFEVSPVLVGANQETATVFLRDAETGRMYAQPRKIAKSLLGMETPAKQDTLTETTTETPIDVSKNDVGLTLAEEGEAALAAAQAFVDRVEALAAKRAEEERTPSDEAVERLKAVGAAAQAVSDSVARVAADIAALKSVDNTHIFLRLAASQRRMRMQKLMENDNE